MHLLIIQGNRVTFSEEYIPAEFQSMVGTVFARLARHPAVLRRITRHTSYNESPSARKLWEAAKGRFVPPKEMPEHTSAALDKYKNFEILRSSLDSL